MTRHIEDIAKRPFTRGVFTGWEREKYRDACGLNPSSIKQPSPKHIKYAYENPGATTDYMDQGTGTHTLVWEPDRFADGVVAYEGTRRGKAWDEFQLEHEGKLILKAEAYQRALAIGTAVASDPLVKVLAKEGIAEMAVFTDENGLQCRGLLDWISTDTKTLCDLKVVNSINERMFGNAVVRYGWDISMCLYRRWFQREENKEIQFVKFICVESKPPHDVAIYTVDEAVLESAWNRAAERIVLVSECIESGVWPGISAGQELPLFTPTWAMDEESVEWEDAA